MPRRARIALPNVPVHLIQRGNNRQPCFFADEDYRRYLDWLTEYADKTCCRVAVVTESRSCARAIRLGGVLSSAVQHVQQPGEIIMGSKDKRKESKGKKPQPKPVPAGK